MIQHLQFSIFSYNTKTFSNGLSIEDCKLGVRFQFLKFCSAHKDEENPQIIFFFNLL